MATNKEHGQQMDSKNIMHLVRLLTTAKEIASEKRINVYRENNREYLLSIRKGEVSLQDIIDQSHRDLEEIKKLFEKSDLPESIDYEMVHKLELNIRRKNLKLCITK